MPAPAPPGNDIVFEVGDAVRLIRTPVFGAGDLVAGQHYRLVTAKVRSGGPLEADVRAVDDVRIVLHQTGRAGVRGNPKRPLQIPPTELFPAASLMKLLPEMVTLPVWPWLFSQIPRIVSGSADCALSTWMALFEMVRPS